MRTDTRGPLEAQPVSDYLTQAQPVEQPLRILCLNYEYPPMGGGAGNATRCIAHALAVRGHTVHVLTSRLPAQPVVETVDGVTVCRVWSLRRSLHECGLFGAASYVVSAFFQLRNLARTYEYDVYHFYFGLPTGLLALYVRFVLGKPYIIALRGSDVPGYDNNKWYMKPLHTVLRPISRLLWRGASAVTALSKNLQGLARRTLPDAECVVIGNGIDGERFPPRIAAPEPSGMRLITVCRMVPRKGLEYLIEAMQELQQDGMTLEIVGSGADYDRIADLVRSRGLERCIKLPGYVPAEQLYKHYQRATIFVLPSLSESFGQVLLEAMSSGLPVVATEVGGIPDTIRENLNGLLVPPRDSVAIVRAIRWLATNPECRHRIGRTNARYARERYGWPAIARRYENLYYEAVGVPRPPVAERDDPWV